MKKIFASILAVAMSMSMFASITSNIRLTLVSESDYEAYVELKTGSDYNPFDPTNCSTYFGTLSNTKNIGMYAIYETANYSNLAASQFVNVPLVVVTSREAASKQNYWLYVDVLGGVAQNSETLTITDLRATGGPQTVELTGSLPNEGLALEFSLDEEVAYVEGTNSVIVDRFVINYNPAAFVTSVTTNDYGWATFSYNQDLVPVNSAIQTLYKGAINGEYLDLTAVDYVPNGQGVIVYGAPNTTYYFAAGSGTADFTGNALKATATYNTSMQNVYVLKGNAFLEYVGTNALAANKAYIQLPEASVASGAPARISFRFNGAQAIENAEMEDAKAVKFIENGQVFIRRGNEVYNLQGQIVK